jgi:uncharacterized membrane protein
VRDQGDFRNGIIAGSRYASLAIMKKEQLEMFNDAVLAIVITLMVLEIKLPELPDGSFWPLIQHIGIYALSFLMVAIVWLNLRVMLRHIEWVCTLIVWYDLILLFIVSLIPLPTQALGEHFQLRESHIFYAIVMAALAAAYQFLHIEVAKRENAGDRKRPSIGKNWIALALYLASIPLSYVSLYLSTGIFILIPALYFVPSEAHKMDEPD